MSSCVCAQDIQDLSELCDECQQQLQESLPPIPVEFEEMYERTEEKE